MKKTKMLALLLAVLMLVSCFAACGKKEEAPAASGSEAAAPAEKAEESGRKTSKEVLILGNKSDVGTLAPFQDSAIQRSRVTMNVYDTLYILENDGSFTPCLATEWTWEDANHCTFKLRDDVVFSNGNKFTADDVLFSLEQALAGAMSGNFPWIDLENCKVVDDYTFTLGCFYSGPKVTASIGMNCDLPILDRETCEADPDKMGTEPVGTGPYVVKEWVVGDTVTLEKNEKYWGEEAIIDTLIFRNISETTQRTIELETGGVDVVYDLQASAVESLQDKVNIIRQDGVLVQNLYFNILRPNAPMANKDLRLAVAYALDKNAIAKGAYNGGATGAKSQAGSGASNSQYLENPDWEYWFPQDVEKAKEHLAAAGYPDGITLKCVVDDSATRVALIEVVQNQLKNVGIEIELLQYDFGTALNYCLNSQNEWDMYVFGNGATDAILQSDRLNNNTAPFLTYTSDELQGILDEIFSNNDAAKTPELLGKLRDYFNTNVPFVPVCVEEVIMATPQNLKGFEIYAATAAYLKDVYFE